MASRLTARLRVLKSLDVRPHRYRQIRYVTQAITIAVLYAVPLLGLARFDLWDGRHLYAGPTNNAVFGLGAVFLSVVGFYVATFVINAVAGRLFCGFGCPVGELQRLGDSSEVARKTGDKRLAAYARELGFGALLAGAAFLWFVDPRVFVEGSPKAVATAIFGFVATTGVFHLHARFVRWSFCKGFCPIGVYYTAIQTNHALGIHFDEVTAKCSGCDVCTEVCPVGLHPRDLTKPIEEMPGLGIEGFPESHHCLTCGDCVRACEQVFSKKPHAAIPLSLSKKPDKRRLPVIPASAPPEAPPAEAPEAVAAE